jgi:hypothetical protein
MKGYRVYRYLILVFPLLGHSGVAQECPAPQQATPFVINVTHEEFPIASLKSRLVRLLTDSLIDEGRGLVDVARERQIQKLMKQLKEKSLYDPHGLHANDDTDDARRARADSFARTDGQGPHNSQTEMQRGAIR